MAMTKKVVPKGTKLKVGGQADYASDAIKGKGNSKKKDIAKAIKNEGGMCAAKKKKK